jgi:N-acetylneuraminic acid mutarotase
MIFPSISSPRSAAAAVTHKSGIYLFGGIGSRPDEFLNTIEIFEKQSQSWKVLPDKEIITKIAFCGALIA